MGMTAMSGFARTDFELLRLGVENVVDDVKLGRRLVGLGGRQTFAEHGVQLQDGRVQGEQLAKLPDGLGQLG
ncbi:MAG: hypothetical protein H0U74_11435, partial [Bradymonadaceae bacterium]|nr:hypothetical protein [Lujinxingiaceae bacterium]